MAAFQLFLFSIFISLALSLLIRAKCRARELKAVRGPPCFSWLTGHEKDIRCQLIAGENELKWTKHYGLIVRLAGCLGQDNLLVSDPKALQYIFHTSGYRFPKTGDMHHLFSSVFGPGLVAVDGEEHLRLRHILNPAFSVGQLRTFLSVFQVEGEKLTEKLQADLASQSVLVDILPWTSKASLDVLGITLFRHAFGALDGKEDKLTSELKKIMMQAFMEPSSAEIVYSALLRLLPRWSLKPLDAVVASRAYTALRMFQTMAKRTASILIQNAMDDKDGLEEKDIVGILAINHLSGDAKNAMSQDAMLAQIVSFMSGGQDTTSNTLGFLLCELARNPGFQVRLRDEIREMLLQKNGEPLTSADYDALPFLNACIKETLRLHPVIHSLIREAAQDDVLPLSEPLILEDGTTCTEIPIRKGQVLYASVSVYQRLEKLWGEETDMWNPVRFLAGRSEHVSISNVGVYANLLTFSAGNRSCIGWRFALMELQVFTVLMVNKFSFELDAEVKFAPTQITIFPALEGKYEEGMKIPLKVIALE